MSVLNEKDRLLIALDKIVKRDTFRMHDDNEVFAKTLMYILERLPDKGSGESAQV